MNGPSQEHPTKPVVLVDSYTLASGALVQKYRDEDGQLWLHFAHGGPKWQKVVERQPMESGK